VNGYDVAFCWGGQGALFNVLGAGGIYSSLTPVRVAGGLHFRRVNAGYSHTCGATTDYRAYCWGSNFNHQLGDGTATSSSKPVAVAGGLSFREVHAGSGYIVSDQAGSDYGDSCGITTDYLAYCWGVGALGGGPRTGTLTAVAGGRRFRSITPGAFHTCAVNRYDVAFCWGTDDSGSGALGNGGGSSETPVRVSGGLRFIALSASGVGRHTCGVTTDYRAYCWGENLAGQLGDGTITNRSTPVAVVGPI
jgi:alpha-tubulin suppressor-like RCC1 family protein